MFRTILVRNENLIKHTLRKTIKGDTIRCLSYGCIRQYQSPK